MTNSERHSREDGGRARVTPSLPAVPHSAFARHWLAVDKGGAELTKAVFGPATRVPLRPAPNDPPRTRPPAPPAPRAPAPTRFRSTVVLLLLVLAVLFAEPAARLLGRALAPRPEAPGTAEVSPQGKAGPRPAAKRAGEA